MMHKLDVKFPYPIKVQSTLLKLLNKLIYSIISSTEQYTKVFLVVNVQWSP
jgi:hypothetical protein